MDNAITPDTIEQAAKAHQKHIRIILGIHQVSKVVPLQTTEPELKTKLHIDDGRVAVVRTIYAPTEYGIPGWETNVEWS